MDNHRYALNIPIPNDEVVPLMVCFGIAIRSNIQVIKLVLLSHVLQIAILEVPLENQRILGPTLDHLVVIVDQVGVVGRDELIGELLLELLVDEN